MTQRLLAVALDAARRAGVELVARLGRQRQVERKGYRDVVTDADTAAEEIVLATIRSAFPGHAILSEEAGEMGGAAPVVWVVDPLDGTTNYARGHPTFSVSVAALEENVPVVGVVHDPLRDHTFAAVRGAGATLNGTPIHVTQSSRLPEAMLALDWSHADSERQRAVERLVALAPRCRTIRALGSAALALAYVGVGWLDVYFAFGLKPWDAAAGGLIVVEAGGKITGIDGQAWRFGNADALATNGALHPAVLAAWGVT
jgi:myo-inositol-1(or 4)-monophosphatase